MGKDARIPVRVSSELKAAFEHAAAEEGTSVSAWLRGLGEERLLELENLAAAEPGEFEPVAVPAASNGSIAAFVAGA